MPQAPSAAKPSALLDTRVIYCGDIANKAQVGDMGIDGRIFPVSVVPSVRSAASRPSQNGLKPALRTRPELGFMDLWYPIQVKQKDKVSRPDIDAFEAVMTREERTKGFFVAFDYSQDALDEIGRFFKQTGKAIVALTVREILDEQIGMKLV